MSSKTKDVFSLRVPGTTSNFGPGFDAFGCALSIFNNVTVRRSNRLPSNSLPDQASAAVAAAANTESFAVDVSVSGDVPQARGLGSSVTIRAAVVHAVNYFLGYPLTLEECLKIVCDLEGHPDNATPAFLGGFTICCGQKIFQTPVSKELKFVIVVPDFEVRTEKARRLLPEKITLKDAVENVRHAALIASAFATGHYRLLNEAFQDLFHEPYRKKLIPAFDELKDAANRLGSLGFFLSGSGSTVIALTDSASTSRLLQKKLPAIWKNKRVQSFSKVLTAHNEPLSIQ